MSLAENKPIDLANIMAVVTRRTEEQISMQVTFPSTIELDWIIYDVEHGEVVHESTAIVKPTDYDSLSKTESFVELYNRTGLTWNIIEKQGVTLNKALS